MVSRAVSADPYVIVYHGEFAFPIEPENLWAHLEQVDRFERHLGWLSEFRLDGKGLQSGSTLSGVITPPLPYRMRLRVDLRECRRPSHIVATVHGDLEGQAELVLMPEGGGTRVTAAWTIEMTQRSMRIAARVARPLLQWGHDRVVEMTVRGFRRHLATDSASPGVIPHPPE
jgi:carbon monoxide dehydrogenase subunit G